jgi:hypothetical protein
VIDVDEVQPDGFLAELDLALARFANFDFFPAKDIGSSDFMDSDRVRHRRASTASGPKREAPPGDFHVRSSSWKSCASRNGGGPGTAMPAFGNLPSGGAFANARALC